MEILSEVGLKIEQDPLFKEKIQGLLVPETIASTDSENKESASTHGYPKDYKVKTLLLQDHILRAEIPDIGLVNFGLRERIEKGEIRLPQGAEGWFYVANWMKNTEVFGKDYPSAVRKILEVLKQTRKNEFGNIRDGMINELSLRQSGRTESFFQSLSNAQNNPDILIVPAQFGLRYIGRSVTQAHLNLQHNEFCLGVFAIACMLITHQNRMASPSCLQIDCSGDEYTRIVGGKFDRAPCFFIQNGKLDFGACKTNAIDKSFGSVSAFLME